MKKSRLFSALAGLAMSLTVAVSPLTALAAPVTMPDGNVFDPEYYAEQNPDVVNAFGTDTSMLYMHYQLCGINEGRLPYATEQVTVTTEDFDAVFYADTYPDLKAAFGYDAALLYQHYINYGKAEGRIGSAGQTVITEDTMVVTGVNYHGLTEADIYARIIAQKANYPEGMRWDYSVGAYHYKGLGYIYGYECAGYAFMMQDLAFGDAQDAKYVERFSRDAFHVGDILRYRHSYGEHSVVVLEVNDNGIVVTEGNYAGTVHWGRSMSWEEIMNGFQHLLTRY